MYMHAYIQGHVVITLPPKKVIILGGNVSLVYYLLENV